MDASRVTRSKTKPHLSSQSRKRTDKSPSPSTSKVVRREPVSLSPLKLSQSSQPSTSSQRSCYENDSQSQATQRSSKTDSSEEDIGHVVNSIVNYLLILDRTKRPIRKTDIVKNALGNSSRNYRLFMEKAEKILKQVFGYKLLEFELGKYLLVNEIENSIPHLQFSSSEKAQKVLLFLVLAHIFLSNGLSTEETLWNFLREVKIVTEDNFQHNYFGDVKHLITADFISQRYLDKKLTESDPPKIMYEWGHRAKAEVAEEAIQKFVAEVKKNRQHSHRRAVRMLFPNNA